MHLLVLSSCISLCMVLDYLKLYLILLTYRLFNDAINIIEYITSPFGVISE